jgi:hypothetical protein
MWSIFVQHELRVPAILEDVHRLSDKHDVLALECFRDAIDHARPVKSETYRRALREYVEHYHRVLGGMFKSKTVGLARTTMWASVVVSYRVDIAIPSETATGHPVAILQSQALRGHQ